jgi:hypothetical protein
MTITLLRLQKEVLRLVFEGTDERGHHCFFLSKNLAKQRFTSYLRATFCVLSEYFILIPRMNLYIVLKCYVCICQVHDEVILEGPTESAEESKAIVVECMSKPFYGTNILKVDLAVDAKYAKSWYAAK